MRVWTIGLLAVLGALPGVAHAQGPGPTVAASDPAGLVAALEQAGDVAKLTTDSYGDPGIDTEFAGWKGSIVFYGCDETTHKNCDSVQFSVGFDRAKPLPLEIADELMKQERFISIHLDDEGDPYVDWDIFTGSGIPTSVFMRSFRLFSDEVQVVSQRVFAEEQAKKAS